MIICGIYPIQIYMMIHKHRQWYLHVFECKSVTLCSKTMVVSKAGGRGPPKQTLWSTLSGFPAV